MHSDALCFLSGKYGFVATDAKDSWFFNMAGNMTDLTNNFNGNFGHFFHYQKQFLFGQNLGENNKDSIFIKVLKCHF